MRWSRSAGGQVVGSLSAVGDIVYAAEFTDNTTTRLHDEERPRGLPLPAAAPTRRSISDGRRIYLTGYSSITALQPFKYKARLGNRDRRPAKPKPPSKARAKRTRRFGRDAARRRRRRGRVAGAKAGKRRVVDHVVEDAEAGRVVLDPVGAGRAEVLVVDEHLAAAVAVDPGHQACRT